MFRLMLPALAVALLTSGGSHPRLARAADTKPIEPFNGKNLDGWKLKDEKKSKWKTYPAGGPPLLDPINPSLIGENIVGKDKDSAASLVNAKGGGTDISTVEKFGDVTVELEFMVPKGSNSGIYLMGEYEIQILDSYGKEKVGPGDLGGLYGSAAPKVNAAKKPGEWQKFVIEFQAPKFEGDKKVANAKFVKVTLNDVVIHENVEMKGSTGGALVGKEAATGPLMFQGDHGPVAFRNIKITPRK